MSSEAQTGWSDRRNNGAPLSVIAVSVPSAPCAETFQARGLHKRGLRAGRSPAGSTEAGMMERRRALSALATLLLLVGAAASAARAESVLRYGIGYTDVPLTTGEPDNGAGA